MIADSSQPGARLTSICPSSAISLLVLTQPVVSVVLLLWFDYGNI